MALSKQDQNFYEEKLSYKSIGYLFGSTCLLGTLLFPIVTYFSVGDKMTANTAYDLAIEGFLLGSVVAFVMYMAFKFLLAMGWLPSRR
jgi:hypothetical protein